MTKSCNSCEEAVVIGEYLNICKIIDDKKECNKLLDKIASEKISSKQLFKIIKKKAKGNSKVLEQLKLIDGFLKNENESEKKRKRRR